MKKLTFLILLLHFTSIAQIAQGDSLMAIGDYQRALNAYKLAPQAADTYFKMARVSIALGDPNAAMDQYITGLKQDSTNLRARFEYGKLLYRTSEFPIAFETFNKLVTDQPENATYHYYIGRIMSALEKEKVALESYTQALKLNPDYRAAIVESLKSLIKTKKSVVAIYLAKNYLNKSPNDIKINSLYAQAMMNAKFYKKAVPVFELLFQLGNDTEYNRKSLAFAHFSSAQYEKALENYEQFLKDYNDKDPTVYFMMSKCYLNLRELDKAQDYIERAIVFKTPILDQEYMQLASVYANKKDLKNALAALKKASKENPNSEDIAYQVVIGADRYYKDKTEKLKYYERFIEKFPNGDYTDMAKARSSDLKKEIFMEKEE